MKPTNHPNKRVLYIPDEIYKPAMELAKNNNISMSDVVRMFLTMWLNNEITPHTGQPPK